MVDKAKIEKTNEINILIEVFFLFKKVAIKISKIKDIPKN